MLPENGEAVSALPFFICNAIAYNNRCAVIIFIVSQAMKGGQWRDRCGILIVFEYHECHMQSFLLA